MIRTKLFVLTFAAILCPARARAQPATPPAAEPPAPEPSTPPPASDTNSVMEAITRDPVAPEIAERMAELDARLKMAETSRKSRFPIKVTGYGDVGFFATQGDGSGFRRDAGHVLFPQYSNVAWVFYGDLLATPVNSRGDVADLGNAPGVNRFDSIHSGGNPTFLANELNLGINAGLGDHALFTSSVNFTPRSGANFALGDSFDVDLVQLEWLPTDDGKSSIFVGKVDSVIGIEYKTRKANERFGITPTLLARYTTGTALGVKARTKLFDDKVILAAAVTNGSFGTEQFHFYDEVDTNADKTLSVRAATRLPLGNGRTFETGVSGSAGTQDGIPNGGGTMWFAGVDAELDLGAFDLTAQWLKGKAPGDAVSMTYSLDLKQGAYLEAHYMMTPVIGLLARAEFRDAIVREGMDRLYITQNWRATGGLRITLNQNAAVKAEYLHNSSFGDVPSVPDDVVTTSAVFGF